MKKLVTLLSLSTLVLLTINLSLAGGGQHTSKATKRAHKLNMKIKNKKNSKQRQAPKRKQAKSARKSKQSTPNPQPAVQYTTVSNKKNTFRVTYGME